MKNKSVYYLISTAGFPNLGDEWITLTWLEAIFDTHPDAEVYLDVHFPSGFKELIKTRSYFERVSCVDFFWQMTYPYDLYHWDAALKLFVKSVQSPLNKQPMLNYLTDILPRVEHIHFLGGGYFTSFWKHHYLLLVLASLMKQEYQMPVYWTGGSLYPIEDFQLNSLFPYLRCFDYISCRDDKTTSMLSGKGTTVPDDLVLGLSLGVVKLPKLKNQRLLFINLQEDLLGVKSNKIIHLLSKKIKLFRDNGYEIVYLEFMPSGDLKSYECILESVPEISLVTFKDLWHTTTDNRTHEMSILHKTCYAIGSRFHFHYLLSWYGVCGEYISNTPYYNNKHHSVCKLGSNWKPFDAFGSVQFQKPLIDHKKPISKKQTEFDLIYSA
jgi:polysaccharide pyruvyl transferase WcaK-like protein